MTLEREPALSAIRAHMMAGADLRVRTVDACAEAIHRAANLLADCLGAGGKVLLCGNGGSAADCQHMAAELVSKMTREIERPGLPVLALTTDTSFLTAFANDYGYEGAFARQVQAFGRPGDILLGISTSGNSRNVLYALAAAREAGMKTIALTGAGGRMAEAADITIAVPSANTQYIQEVHLAVEHLLCYFVERTLFAPDALSSLSRKFTA